MWAYYFFLSILKLMDFEISVHRSLAVFFISVESVFLSSSPGGLMNRGLRPRRRAILTADMGTNLKVHGWLIQQLSTTLV